MPFTLFGISHSIVIFFTLFLSLLTFWANKFSGKQQSTIQTFLAFLLSLQIIVFNSWHLYFGSFDITRFLPFHLCTISAYISVLALLIKKNWLYKLQFFWAPAGAFVALVLPDIGANENFPSFRFIEFFWSHSLIVIISFWIIATQNLQLKYSDVWKYFGLLLVFCFGVVFWINKLIGSNYMYLMNKPSGGQMNFLPSEPYHVLGLVGILLLIFNVQFFVWKYLVSRRFKSKFDN